MKLFQLALGASLLVTANAQVQTRPPYPVGAQAQSLKQQIIQICLANQTRTDNWPEVRAQLDPLIAQLTAITPPRTEPEKLYQVAGNWYQVWSDAPFYRPTRAFSIDLKTVYQVVFPGYYYNVSAIVPTDGSGPFTGFLKGVYKVNTNSLQPLFTKYVYGIGVIPPGADITTYAMWAEAGLYDSQPAPFFSPSLVPLESPLLNQYVDYDFRILTNPPGGNGAKPAIFVLVRANTV
ncbi:MAG: hypothetical protein ACKV2U_30805 [Bryobacteraceae bacterium]